MLPVRLEEHGRIAVVDIDVVDQLSTADLSHSRRNVLHAMRGVPAPEVATFAVPVHNVEEAVLVCLICDTTESVKISVGGRQNREQLRHLAQIPPFSHLQLGRGGGDGGAWLK